MQCLLVRWGVLPTFTSCKDLVSDKKKIDISVLCVGPTQIFMYTFNKS